MNFRNLLAGMALLLFVNFFTACQKDVAIDDAPAANTAKENTKVIHATSMTDHYLSVIEKYKAKGRAVRFDAGNGQWVENPDRAWLQAYFHEGGAADRTDPNHDFTLEGEASVDIFLIQSWLYNSTVSFTQSITYPSANTLYVTSSVTKPNQCYIVRARGKELNPLYGGQTGTYSWAVKRFDSDLNQIFVTSQTDLETIDYSSADWPTYETSWCP